MSGLTGLIELDKQIIYLLNIKEIHSLYLTNKYFKKLILFDKHYQSYIIKYKKKYFECMCQIENITKNNLVRVKLEYVPHVFNQCFDAYQFIYSLFPVSNVIIDSVFCDMMISSDQVLEALKILIPQLCERPYNLYKLKYTDSYVYFYL
jgi:hypothetical protein